jgi:nitrogen fixation protein NifU and related proteins
MPQLPDVPLEGLYGDVIMGHYRNPRHRNPVSDADVEAHEFNPFCGDEVTLQIKLDGEGYVTEVSSVSQGCSIIQASASMMAELMEGKSPTELIALSQLFRDLMHGKPVPDGSINELGDLEALQVVRQYPVRIKCALLPWTALEEGIKDL